MQISKRNIVAGGLLIALVLATGCGRKSGLEYWFVDSLVKVFPDDAAGSNELAEADFDAARNSNVSIQLAMRSDAPVGDLYVDVHALSGPGVPIDTIAVRWVDHVVVTTNTANTPREELVREAPALFPDVIFHEFPITLKKDRTTSIWITIQVPAGQAPGVYRGRIRLRQGTEPFAAAPFRLIVREATVPSPIPLRITNYFNLSDRHLQQFYGCSQYSDCWWDLIRNMAGFMARYYQTSIGADPVQLAKADIVGGQVRYNLENFERFVETFKAAGVPGPIEGGNLLERQRRRDATMMVPAWINDNGKAALQEVPFKDPRAQQFLNTFLPALREVLQRRGWSNDYLQGILDEPNEWERADFVQTAELVRKYLPGVRTIEPVGAKQDLAFMEKTVDIWVPLLGSFDDKLPEMEAHVRRGGEVWFYTCLAPRGKYPNRFIDYSLLKVRLLHWINYKHDFKGFLHWGGNFWGPAPLLDTQPVINEGRTYLPPGDAYITYPDRLGRSFYSSIRLEQMREGIEDFGLLTELARYDEAKADEIAAETVKSFTDYVRDEKTFRQIHRKLLVALSETKASRISQGIK
ncbi:MAG: DUF4091 domain-containing protein [Bryobacteraceae bacterium]|nr:DUF4091 domain-containing protein [Bryobacteraceae bacterium]